MIKTHYPYIVIGGGIASLSAIQAIHERDQATPILLISEEDRLPYKRTKINKHIHHGFSGDAFALHEDAWYKDHAVTLLGDQAIGIFAADNTIVLKKTGTYSYEKLLIATGASPIRPRISGIDMSDLLTVRTASQVEQVMSTMKTAHNYLVIGAGVEGLETAEQLNKSGKKVVLVDRLNYPMERLFPAPFMTHLLADLAHHNITFYPNTMINTITKTRNKQYITKIQAEEYCFDVLIACSGALPNISLAKQSGLNTNRGILVNEFLQTSEEHIYAAGDVAEHGHDIVTGLWHAAEHQGDIAGRNMAGDHVPHSNPPFRLKTDLFNTFYYSQNYPPKHVANILVKHEKKGDKERYLYVENNRIVGTAMMNDKERAGEYQQAIIKGITLTDMLNNIPLT